MIFERSVNSFPNHTKTTTSTRRRKNRNLLLFAKLLEPLFTNRYFDLAWLNIPSRCPKKKVRHQHQQQQNKQIILYSAAAAACSTKDNQSCWNLHKLCLSPSLRGVRLFSFHLNAVNWPRIFTRVYICVYVCVSCILCGVNPSPHYRHPF